MHGETVFLFSGQGSQYFQMGRELLGENATFRGWMQRMDEMARPLAGQSITAAIYAESRAKSEPFDRTLLTHPAIFMVEYALAQTLIASGLTPDLVLGVSLGSFVAAAVAGSLTVEEALTAVIAQAKILEESCEPGGMIAILADPALCEEEFLRTRTELVAVNFDSHFVVSAPRADLAAVEAVLKQRNIAHQRLPVSFPFHSRWIETARQPFLAVMRSLRPREPRLPIVCSERAAVVGDLTGDYFWGVVRRPMRFREAIAQLEAGGSRRYIDVGPAGTLATFLRYGILGQSRSTVHPILTPFGADRRNLSALLESALVH